MITRLFFPLIKPPMQGLALGAGVKSQKKEKRIVKGERSCEAAVPMSGLDWRTGLAHWTGSLVSITQ